MSKHTPEPWEVSPETCEYEVADETKKELCKQYGFATKFRALAITYWK